MRGAGTSLIAALMLLLAAIDTAPAAEIEATGLRGQPAIRLSGLIVQGDEIAFRSKLTAMTARPIVVLWGPGGAVDPAIRIGLMIQELGLTTLVPPDEGCASSCSIIWLGGAHRKLAQGAKIGFHAMSIQRQGGRVETHEHDDALRTYLTRLGYALDATATIVNTPATLLRWLDEIELTANGIATEPYP